MLLPLLLAATAQFQDTAALDRAVAAFTAHATGEAGGARAGVDPRLRLATCPMVSMSWRTEAHDAVVVTCTGPSWRLFVPVIRPAGAAVATPAYTAAATPALAKGPPVIKRGDPVLVEANADGFAITREGIAMGDAAAGGRFLVKVDQTKQPVQAVATADGRATLPGWGE
jgi:flagella basal body P-ring formation protein FlgA